MALLDRARRLAERRQRHIATPDVHVEFVVQQSALGWIGIDIHLVNRTSCVWDLISAEARPLRRCRLATKFIREGPMPGAILRIPPVNLEASFAAATRGPIDCRTRVNPSGAQAGQGQPGDQAQCRLFLLTERAPRFVSLRLTLRSLEANTPYRVTFRMPPPG